MDSALPKPNASGASREAKIPVRNGQASLCALGHYRILRSLGAGGMSEVYLAYDPEFRAPVAIKVLADHLVDRPVFVNRFLQEGRLGKRLSHPNIVRAHDFGRDEETGKYYIVMEYVDGPTAQELLERDGRLPVSQATALIIDVARSLEYLHHHRFVHRDIKPGNILIGPDGSAKLIDLGVAKELANDELLTSVDQGVGTPYYMPWEQGVNSGLVDARSDIFALGATFYHLLTGHVPFPGDDEVAINRNKMRGDFIPIKQHDCRLPSSIEAILQRMLARDPRARFASCEELVEVLSAACLTEISTRAYVDEPTAVPQPQAPTRADLRSQSEIDTPLESGSEQLWRVKFQHPLDGTWRKARGRTHEVVRLYEEGVLPDVVFAAREGSKIYRKLRAYPEFRNLNRRTNPATSEPKRTKPLKAVSRRPRSKRTWSRASQYIGTIVFTGGLTLLLCSTLAVLMRLLACLN